jgi:predicted SnoaL-like aldol condensation-catalyzing enzyme
MKMEDMQNEKNIAISFLQEIVAGNISAAYDKYVAEDFIHHNPYFANSRDALKTGMIENEGMNPNKIYQVQRAIAEENQVMVHGKIQVNEQITLSAVHIFKFCQGKIIELWDISQVVPTDMVNELGMF